MDVLVVGSGGREYEIARQLALSDKVTKVYVAPGNGGTETLNKCENAPFAALDIDGIAGFVKQKAIPWVVAGPEAPLVAGIADPLRAAGVVVFGPSKAAARLEGSKLFAADFMQQHNIPQPERQTAHNLEEALGFIKGRDPKTYVLKADGLASGKGVVLPSTADEAEETLRDMFSGEGYEGAGKESVTIQERLHGPEISAFAISDGTNYVLLPFSQDHKRLLDNDEGPNTGGVGAYTPLPESIASKKVAATINTIITKTIKGMADAGTPFQGVLFLGLMLAEERGGDAVMIEYNVRFGDPEVEALFALLNHAGVDAADMLWKASQGDVTGINLPTDYAGASLAVALSSHGYPVDARKGDEVKGLDKQYDGVIVQHAGTKREGDKILTSGGRVLYVTGFGNTIDEAAAKAYAAIGENGIHFDGMQYRKDIGHQARTA